MFLNGRIRHHRKYLLELFRYRGLLDQALWTNLDPRPSTFRPLELPPEIGILNWKQTTFPLQQLPPQYEVDRYRSRVGTLAPDTERDLYTKYHLFNDEWGDIYLNADPYIDTYFSVVTETVFEYPYSFRTEKTWKPIAMGHPTVFVSSAGYYRDFRRLGFRTWGHLIDESFDQIDNNQDRLDRIADVVRDLCSSNLDEFLVAAQAISKYNQQRMAELGPRIQQEFPDRFWQFLQHQ